MTAATTLSFAALTRRQQLARLRVAASQAAVAFGFTDATLDLVAYDYNATYRAHAPGASARAALRINVNSRRAPDEVSAEVEWVRALSSAGTVATARPIPPVTAGPIAVEVEGHDRMSGVAAYEWIGAPVLGDRVGVAAARRLGEIMAALHEHAASWPGASGLNRPRYSSILMESPDRLADLDRPWYDGDDRRIVEEARRAVEELVAPVFAGPTLLVHADLHPWNVTWRRGEMTVFDFDDCGVAPPLFDLSIAAFYLRDRPELGQALLDGYGALRQPPADAESVAFEALVTSRSLLMLNDVVDSVSLGEDFAAKYTVRTARRLRHWLRTGSFALDPPD